jgi:putative transposase
MYRSYQFRLLPTGPQEAKLIAVLSDNRETYNAAIQERREAWRLQRKNISYYDQQAQLTALRQDRRFAMTAVDIQRDPIRRVDRAFADFFRRCKSSGSKPGYPRFKAASRYRSFEWGACNRPSITPSHIRVPNIGQVRYKSTRQVIGEPKIATIKQIGRKWTVNIRCDVGPAPEKHAVSKAIGIDVGLINFVTLSDGRSVNNPRWVRKHSARIAAANRLLARKQKQSKNRTRAKEVLRRAHQRVANERLNFIHHISKWLISQYDMVAFEKLNIVGMVHGKLAKSILDTAWSELVWQITYKAESAGKWAVPVNPRWTSMRCSGCGAYVCKTLADRVHVCACGINLGRDHNAALNILALGRSAVGLPPPELEPQTAKTLE